MIFITRRTYIEEEEQTQGGDPTTQFQPALKSVFCPVNEDGIPVKESVKGHLWSLHFAEYGRSVRPIFFKNI